MCLQYIVQASHPQKRDAITMSLQSQSFVESRIFCCLRLLVRSFPRPWFALLILDVTTLSSEPLLEILLPRYLKLLTYFSWVSSAKIVGSGVLLFGAVWQRTQVLLRLRFESAAGFCSWVPIPRSGELQTQKWKSYLVRTQSLNVLPLKPGVGQYIAIHNTLTATDFFLTYFYPSGPFTSIFSKTSSNLFPVLALVNTCSCAGQQNKIGHPAKCRFPLSARGL